MIELVGGNVVIQKVCVYIYICVCECVIGVREIQIINKLYEISHIQLIIYIFY